MKICSKCGHENNDTSKFCAECGEKLVSSPKFCPECGNGLEGTPKFCPECGYNFVTGEAFSYQEDDEPDELDVQENIIGTYSYDSEELCLLLTFKNDNSISMRIEEEDGNLNGIYELDGYDVTISVEEEGSDEQVEFTGTFSNDFEILRINLDGTEIELTKNLDSEDVYNDYSDYDDDSSYEEDVDEIRKIVDKYLLEINKSSTAYTYEELHSAKNSVFLHTIKFNISKDHQEEDILGFIDNTVFGKGKAGLVFTTDALYEGSAGASWKVPYWQMGGMTCNGKKIVFEGTEDCGIGWLKRGMDITIDSTWYNIPALKDCLEEIYQAI